ncbi:hypothetical protein J2S43_001899 [Catenuloplanes nepalensis]|uniref:Fibronectin type-III domain-containing protein n=1 Tax=Catenuloplanes nepalensis TaxID=587533 RepID=A0ABT9MPM8_9ACTN|nr:hypothetical protein [Catenuloplanes nepalensis]MDP9793387.1 hypothetical protein [Catenuloplanes nepalensis]
MMLRTALTTGLATLLLGTTAPPPTTTTEPSPAPAAAPESAAAPDPPVDVVAVAGVSSIRASWQNPPVDTGVANYVAFAEPGGGNCGTLDWRTFGCVLGVRAGVSYRVGVRSNGTSVPAYAPARVTAGAPRAPYRVPAKAVDLMVERHGGRIEVGGDGFLPHSSVVVAGYRRGGAGPVALMGPVALTGPVADADGRLAAVARPPDGVVTLLARGVDPAGETRTLTAALPKGSGGGGGLPITGGRATVLFVLGLALVLLGALALAATGKRDRRRRTLP